MGTEEAEIILSLPLVSLYTLTLQFIYIRRTSDIKKKNALEIEINFLLSFLGPIKKPAKR